jgi:hypothetical protein
LLPPEALRAMRVMIATPCYASGAMSNYVVSMVSLAAECVKAGLPIRFEMHAESLITRGRNRLVSIFLSDKSLTHLFFIDADIGFVPASFFRILLADRDVAAGVYPLKRYEWPKDGVPQAMSQREFEARFTPYPINPLPSGTLDVDSDRFGEVAEAPTGFMCIKRAVFDRLKAGYPNLKYSPEWLQPGDDPDSNYLFFDTLVDPDTRRYLSEDYAFCRRWRDIGGKVSIDVNSRLGHQGQHTWTGDLVAHLDARAKR